MSTEALIREAERPCAAIAEALRTGECLTVRDSNRCIELFTPLVAALKSEHEKVGKSVKALNGIVAHPDADGALHVQHASDALKAIGEES